MENKPKSTPLSRFLIAMTLIFVFAIIAIVVITVLVLLGVLGNIYIALPLQ